MGKQNQMLLLPLSASPLGSPARVRELRPMTSWRPGVPWFPHGVTTLSMTATPFLPLTVLFMQRAKPQAFQEHLHTYVYVPTKSRIEFGV